MAADLYLRLDTLQEVCPDRIEWGQSVQDVVVRRSHLHREQVIPSRAPYLPISARRAVRLVPVNGLDDRAATIAALAVRDGGCCLYCGLRLDLASCQIEHVVPTSAGGPDHASNLALTCKPCNAAAGSLPAAQKVLLAVRQRVGTVLLAASQNATSRRKK